MSKSSLHCSSFQTVVKILTGGIYVNFFPHNIFPSGLIMYFMQRHPGHATRIRGESSFYYAPFHFRLQRKIKDKSIISESSH